MAVMASGQRNAGSLEKLFQMKLIFLLNMRMNGLQLLLPMIFFHQIMWAEKGVSKLLMLFQQQSFFRALSTKEKSNYLLSSIVLFYGDLVTFKLFGIKFTVEYSFLLMLSFGIILGAGDIPALLLFSALHELGHLFMLIMCCGRADSLTLSFYGLALKYSSVLSRAKETLVLIAGPFVNLVLYLILKDDINLLLLVINMLPVYPIDFGRIIRLYSYNLSKAAGIFSLIILVILSLYLLIFYKSFSLVFIVCYLMVYTINY